MVFCSKCGTPNHSGKFCSKCGAILDQTAMSRDTAVNAGIIQPTKTGGSSPKAGSGAVALAVSSPPASPSNSTKPVIAASQPRSDANASTAAPGSVRQKLEGEVVMWGTPRKTNLLWISTLVLSTTLLVCVVAPQWFIFTNTVSNLESHRGLWDWQTAWEVDADCNPTYNNPTIPPPRPYLHSKDICQKFYTVRAFAALSILAGLIGLYFLHFHQRFRALLFIVPQVICSMIAFAVADAAFKESLYESSRTNTVGFVLIVFGWVLALIGFLCTCLRLFNLSLMCAYVAHFLFCVACAHAEWIAVYPNNFSREVFYLSPFGFGQQYDSDNAGPGVEPINKTEQILAQGFGVGAFVSLCIAATFMYSRFKHLAHYFYSSAALACLLSWAFSIHLFGGTATDFGLSFWMFVICTLPLFVLIWTVHPDYNADMIDHLPPEQRAEYGNNTASV